MSTTTIEDGIDLANEIMRGTGPDLDTMEQKHAAARALVESGAFSWSQAAEFVGWSKATMYQVSYEKSKDFKRPEGKRTAGGVAGKLVTKDISKIRYARLQMAGDPKRATVPDRVRTLIKSILEGGTSPTVLAHLTGMSPHTLRKVKAKKLWY